VHSQRGSINVVQSKRCYQAAALQAAAIKAVQRAGSTPASGWHVMVLANDNVPCVVEHELDVEVFCPCRNGIHVVIPTEVYPARERTCVCVCVSGGGGG
jgi:hypothetical protein